MWTNERWLLPDGIEEILPEDAWRMEDLRRRLLDHFDRCGYDLVMPPLIEYLESLLTGTGEDLDLQTFKVTDQHSGRTMGVRADMTPQVARIEAHFLRADMPVRLCYIGSTLLARAPSVGDSREPLQFGAELFGSADPRADGEILALMARSLRLLGIEEIHIDIGHVGVYRELARAAELDDAQAGALFEAFQRKSQPDIAELLAGFGLAVEVRSRFMELAQMNGGLEVLDRATARLESASPGVAAALGNLRAVVDVAVRAVPDTPMHLDLAELRGYRYHTGVVFSAFEPGSGRAIARGGRYDDIGAAFGHSRPATGFSADLRRLLRLLPPRPASSARAIAAPCDPDRELQSEIDVLRDRGERVVTVMPEHTAEDVRALCNRELVRRDGRWTVQGLADSGSGG